MGELAKFGIKLGLAIATAVALVASLALLYVNIATPLGSIESSGYYSGYFRDIMRIFSVVFPFNFMPVISLFGPLFAFKIAYWAADKMIQFIDSIG